MVISVSLKREFIPEFHDNKKLQASEQIRIKHRAATTAIKEQLFPRRFQMNANGDITGNIEIDRKKIIQAFTDELVNISYESDDGEIKKISTVEQLFKAPVEFDPLIEELYNYYNGLLNARPNEKN